MGKRMHASTAQLYNIRLGVIFARVAYSLLEWKDVFNLSSKVILFIVICGNFWTPYLFSCPCTGNQFSSFHHVQPRNPRNHQRQSFSLSPFFHHAIPLTPPGLPYIRNPFYITKEVVL